MCRNAASGGRLGCSAQLLIRIRDGSVVVAGVALAVGVPLFELRLGIIWTNSGPLSAAKNA